MKPRGTRAPKTFKAPTAKEVLSRISRELGPDAVIIAHQKTLDTEGESWVQATASPRAAGTLLSPDAVPAAGAAEKRSARAFLLPALGLVSSIVIGAAAWRILSPTTLRPALPAKLSAAVVGFENDTGDASCDFLAKVIPNLMITRFEQSGFFDVTSWERMQGLLEQRGRNRPGTSGLDLAFEVCREEGIEALITGSFTKTGSLFATDVKLLDVETRQVRARASSQGVGEESILRSQVDELGRGILQGFGFFSGRSDETPVRIADITTGSMDAYYHFLRGRESYSNENLKDARVFLEKAVLLDPQFAMAHFYLASSLSISGERPAALEICRKAMSLAERATEKERMFIQGLGNIMVSLNYDESTRIFTEMVRRFPREKDAHYGLGLTLFSKGLQEAGIGHLQKALELDPYDSKTLGLIAAAYVDLRDYQKALAYYDRQVAASPGNGLARVRMAAVYLTTGKLDEALAKCDEAFEADPDVRLSATVGYIYALGEDYGKALRLMDQLVQVEKYSLFQKSVLYYLAGNLRQAESDVRRLREYASTVPARQSEANALWVAGWIALERGDGAAAEASFQGWFDIYALEILPRRENSAAIIKHWRAWLSFYLGLSALKQGMIGTAKARLAEIETALPDILPDYRRWIAYCRNSLEAEISLAEGDAQRAIYIGERPPRSAGRSERQNDWLRNAPFLRDVLARAYRQGGDVDKAIAEYERLITFNRRSSDGEYCLIHPKYYYRLAELYEEKGLKQEAVRSYERFLDLWRNADPDSPEGGETRRRLARLKGVD